MEKHNKDHMGVACSKDKEKESVDSIDLVNKNIGAWKASKIASKSLPELRYVNLSVNPLGVWGARTLSRNTTWKNLSGLSLAYCDLGPAGARALAKNKSWVNLSIINLTDNHIGNEGAIALSKNTSWKNLSTIILNCNNISVDGEEAIGKRWPEAQVSC